MVPVQDDTGKTVVYEITGCSDPFTVQVTGTGNKVLTWQGALDANYAAEILHIYYIYGEVDQSGENQKNDYLTLPTGNNGTATILGRGTHTFYAQIKYKGRTDFYYFEANVTDEDRPELAPVVVAYGGAVGVFHYDLGDDVISIAYAKGTYNTWAAMKDKTDLTYVPVGNVLLDINTFDASTTYTFCFKTADKDYFATVEIPSYNNQAE